MKYKIVRVFLSAVVSAALAQLSGCSVVGFTVGALSDHSESQRKDTLSAWALTAKIKPGKTVTAVCVDGSVTTATLLGKSAISPDEYRMKFNVSNPGEATRTAAAPIPGTIVGLKLRSGEQISGELLGYDIGLKPQDQFVKTSSCEGIVSVKRMPGGAIQRFRASLFEEIISVDSSRISSAKLTTQLRDHQIPTISALELSQGGNKVSIPIDMVNYAWYSNHPHRKWSLLGVGLVVDAGLAVALALTLNGSNLGL